MSGFVAPCGDLEWSTDHAEGTFDEWKIDNELWWNTSIPPGHVEIATSSDCIACGHSVKFFGVDFDTDFGCRAKMKRAHGHTEFMHSCWHMYPVLPTVVHTNAGSIMIQQVKAEPDPVHWIAVKQDNGNTIMELREWGAPGFNDDVVLPPNAHAAIPILAGEWFHLRWYFKDGIADGISKIWHNGILCWDYEDINTRGAQAGKTWGPVVYGHGLDSTPSTLIMYIDCVREYLP